MNQQVIIQEEKRTKIQSTFSLPYPFLDEWMHVWSHVETVSIYLSGSPLCDGVDVTILVELKFIPYYRCDATLKTD